MRSVNIGTPERLIRLLVGVMLLGLYGALAAPWKYLTLIGIALIASALSGFCPLYHLLGRTSRSG
ncbi:MAG TPA: DUF2892 domain-containing protein [Gemmatimonadales bacterium]|jgi:hypothetical protein